MPKKKLLNYFRIFAHLRIFAYHNVDACVVLLIAGGFGTALAAQRCQRKVVTGYFPFAQAL